MIKFVLVLIFAANAPGDPPTEARRIFTAPYETKAACMLSGEVELILMGEPDGKIECAALEFPDGAY